jgi:hypothetical protein
VLIANVGQFLKQGGNIQGVQIQDVTLKTGPLARRNQESWTVFSGTLFFVWSLSLNIEQF